MILASLGVLGLLLVGGVALVAYVLTLGTTGCGQQWSTAEQEAGMGLEKPTRPTTLIGRETAESLELLATHQAEDSIADLGFSPDGRALVIARGRTVAWWDTTTERVLYSVRYREAFPVSVAYHPSQPLLAVGNNDVLSPNCAGTALVELWDLERRARVRTYLVSEAGRRLIESVALSPDGRALAAAGHIPTIWLWDVGTADLLSQLPPPEEWTREVAFSPDGTLLAARGFSRLEVRDVWSAALTVAWTSERTIMDIAWSPDGARLAVAVNGSEGLQLWDKAIDEWSAVSDQPSLAVAYSADGSILAVATHEEVQVRDASTYQILGTVRRGKFSVSHLAFSPDGYLLAGGGANGTLILWGIP